MDTMDTKLNGFPKTVLQATRTQSSCPCPVNES